MPGTRVYIHRYKDIPSQKLKDREKNLLANILRVNIIVGLQLTFFSLFGQSFKRARIFLTNISSCLELDDLVLGEAEVHPLRVLEVEGALVQLGHRVIRPQERCLLVHLSDD